MLKYLAFESSSSDNEAISGKSDKQSSNLNLAAPNVIGNEDEVADEESASIRQERSVLKDAARSSDQ